MLLNGSLSHSTAMFARILLLDCLREPVLCCCKCQAVTPRLPSLPAATTVAMAAAAAGEAWAWNIARGCSTPKGNLPRHTKSAQLHAAGPPFPDALSLTALPVCLLQLRSGLRPRVSSQCSPLLSMQPSVVVPLVTCQPSVLAQSRAMMLWHRLTLLPCHPCCHTGTTGATMIATGGIESDVCASLAGLHSCTARLRVHARPQLHSRVCLPFRATCCCTVCMRVMMPCDASC